MKNLTSNSLYFLLAIILLASVQVNGQVTDIRYYQKDQQVPHTGGAFGISDSPAAIEFQGKLFCFRQGRSGQSGDICYFTFDGQEYSGDKYTDYGISGSPALAVFQDKLYIFRQGRSAQSGDICYLTFDGTTFADHCTSYGISGSPTATVFQDKLYIFRQGRSGQAGDICYLTFDGKSFADHCTNHGISGSPSATVYQDKLFVFRQGRSAQAGDICYLTFDGTTFGDYCTSYGISESPSVVVYEDILYCFRQGRSAQEGDICYLTYDGNAFYEHFTSSGITDSPSVTIFNEKLYCYHQGRSAQMGDMMALIAHPKPPSPLPVVTDTQKMELINTYAPYLYMDIQETFYASTVEFSFPYLERYLNADGTYWLRTIESLDEPSSTLTYFRGDQENAKVYAFWVDKDFGISEIVYFIYYPYNRGKEMVNTIWGNHVGDWEHVTVRLLWDSNNMNAQLVPVEVFLSAHDGGNTRDWLGINKNNNSPIVYSARGSHAMYFDAGGHAYKNIPVLGDLIDYCSKGSVMDCAQDGKIEAFDFTDKKGLNGKSWPFWMSYDFSESGLAPSNPSSGSVNRWGNQERGCEHMGINVGACRLENGPTGPNQKWAVWAPEIFE